MFNIRLNNIDINVLKQSSYIFYMCTIFVTESVCLFIHFNYLVVKQSANFGIIKHNLKQKKILQARILNLNHLTFLI